MRSKLITVYKQLFNATQRHAVNTGNQRNVMKINCLKLNRNITLTEKELLSNMSKMATYCNYPEYMYLQK